MVGQNIKIIHGGSKYLRLYMEGQNIKIKHGGLKTL